MLLDNVVFESDSYFSIYAVNPDLVSIYASTVLM
jgi:hypothetical protein